MAVKTTPIDTGKSGERKSAPRSRVRVSDEKIRGALSDVYNMIGMAAIPFDPVYAQFVMDKSDDLADAWMDLAENNPKVRTYLQRFTEGSGVGTIIMAHAMMVAPLLAKRGIIPAPIGVSALASSTWVQENGGLEFATSYIVGSRDGGEYDGT